MLGLLGRKNKEVTMVDVVVNSILLVVGIVAMVVSLLIKHKY